MKLQEWLVLGLIFFLTFANTDVKVYQLLTGTGGGLIQVQHGFYIPMALALVLIALKFNQKEAGGINSGGNLKLIYPLLLWFLAATLSFLFNTWYENTFTSYIGGYLSLIIIYFALRDIPLNRQTFERIMMAFSLGIFITLALGVSIYYRIWGIPSITTLIMSRYEQVRMQVYRNMTFGNVDNSAAFFVMIAPSFLALALDKTRKGWMRVWFTICFLLVGCNLLITGSRTALVLMLLAVILIFYYFRQLGKLLFLSMLAIVGGLFAGVYFNLSLSGGVNLFIERLVNAVTLNQDADFAIFSRIEAMKEGWRVFNDHWLVGVGPGSSYYQISAGTAHQFFIQQAAQLGILGFFATIILVCVACWGFVRMILRRGAGRAYPLDAERFILLIGPVMFLLYGVLANITLNSGSVNIWVAVLGAFLALAEFREQSTGCSGVSPKGASPKDASPEGALDTSWQLKSG